MLAKLLERHGHPPFDYMLGSRDGWSHAWIQQGDLIVDISADQFDDYGIPVTVVRGSAWHEGFAAERLHVADFMLYNLAARNALARAFRYVESLLPTEMRRPAM